MAVYKRSYKPYDGPLTPERTRFLVLPRYAIQELFESRVLTAYLVLCLVPFLIELVLVYVANSAATRALLHIDAPPSDFLQVQFFLIALGSLLGTILLFYTFALLLFVLLSWVAPGTYSPASALVSSLCEPLLAPVRRVIPPLGGIDFSAAFVIIALWALYIAINEYLLTPGY